KSEDGSTAACAKLQLKSARKLMCGKHFLVKGDLKTSFIDPAPDLNHIRVRRGPDVAFRKAISRTRDDGAGLWSFFDTPDQGEHYDSQNHLQRQPKPPASCHLGIRAADFTRRPACLWAADPPTLLQQLKLGRPEPLGSPNGPEHGNCRLRHNSERRAAHVLPGKQRPRPP